MARSKRPEPPEECSRCNSPVPRDAWACPECGADEVTGWDRNPWIPGETEIDIPDYLTEDYDEQLDGPVTPYGGSLRTFWIGFLVVFAVLFGIALLAAMRSH